MSTIMTHTKITIRSENFVLAVGYDGAQFCGSIVACTIEEKRVEFVDLLNQQFAGKKSSTSSHNQWKLSKLIEVHHTVCSQDCILAPSFEKNMIICVEFYNKTNM